MKLISIHVSEKTYGEFRKYAEHQDRPVAELIREAMEFYRERKIQPQTALKRMPTAAKPKLKRRWTREEIQKELLG